MTDKYTETTPAAITIQKIQLPCNLLLSRARVRRAIINLFIAGLIHHNGVCDRMIEIRAHSSFIQHLSHGYKTRAFTLLNISYGAPLNTASDRPGHPSLINGRS